MNVLGASLREAWTERLAAFSECHCASRGFEVLGTARRDRPDFTLVRMRFNNGSQDLAFVWDGKPDGRLLGISLGGMSTDLRFRAEGSGAGAWLVVGDGERRIEARRPGPAP